MHILELAKQYLPTHPLAYVKDENFNQTPWKEFSAKFATLLSAHAASLGLGTHWGPIDVTAWKLPQTQENCTAWVRAGYYTKEPFRWYTDEASNLATCAPVARAREVVETFEVFCTQIGKFTLPFYQACYLLAHLADGSDGDEMARKVLCYGLRGVEVFKLVDIEQLDEILPLLGVDVHLSAQEIYGAYVNARY